VLISDESDHVAGPVQQGFAVLAASEMIRESGLQVGLDIIVHIVGEPPPYFEATDLDDHIVIRHGPVASVPPHN
jgi:hypothetical protein